MDPIQLLPTCPQTQSLKFSANQYSNWILIHCK
uniref:Uncharacterized protein n=1 Tax=Rhizophora mucronata TaxID=61149 RepID=A0A2P2PD70_RHIMU